MWRTHTGEFSNDAFNGYGTYIFLKRYICWYFLDGEFGGYGFIHLNGEIMRGIKIIKEMVLEI